MGECWYFFTVIGSSVDIGRSIVETELIFYLLVYITSISFWSTTIPASDALMVTIIYWCGCIDNYFNFSVELASSVSIFLCNIVAYEYGWDLVLLVVILLFLHKEKRDVHYIMSVY